MLRRTSLTLISDNKTFRKKLSLLIKDQISGQTQLNLKLTQIEWNLNVSRIIIQCVLRKLQTTFFEVNELRSERLISITLHAVRILLRQLRSKSKIIWRQLKMNIEIDLNARTLNATLRAYEISHWLAFKRSKLTSEAARLRLNELKHMKIELWINEEKSFDRTRHSWLEDQIKHQNECLKLANRNEIEIKWWKFSMKRSFSLWFEKLFEILKDRIYTCLIETLNSKNTTIQQSFIFRFWNTIWLTYESQN